MEPTRDTSLDRIKAFLDGLGIFTLFALILLVILGIGSVLGWFQKGELPEDAAGDIRYEIRDNVRQEQEAFLKQSDITAAMENTVANLISSKPTAIEKPEQLVPGSKTAKALEDAPAPDLSAVDVEPVAQDEPIDPEVMALGKAQFLVCGACHGQNGEGGPAAPPLAESEWVTGPVSNLILIQLRGLKGPIEVKGKTYEFPAGMTPMAYQTDDQIAAVLTYIRNSFGNEATAVTPGQVTALRSEVGRPQVTVEELTKP